MTSDASDSTPTDDAPVTIATFPNPYEAELAHAALESRGIPAVVQNDHGQYLSAGAWVQLQVAASHRELARTLLERGPLDETAGAEVPDAVDALDDLAPLRVNRRILLGRWFLYAGAVTFLLSVYLLPLSLVAFALVLWSRHDPRRAFALAYGLQSVVVLVSVAIAGLGGLTTLIPLVAFYFARAAAAPAPQPSLVASPYWYLRSVEIGEGWKAGEASLPPTALPIWFLRDAGVLLFLLVIVTGLAVAVSSR
jgi:hypothetical protein